jgi:ribosomal protein L37AE/L43A
MMDKDDWRLTDQLDYLFGVELLNTVFRSEEMKRDHDHCEFCMKKFPQEVERGFCTVDKYYWICETCYDDFKEMFKWKVKPI